MDERGKLALTYDTLFELVRREKSRDDLQKMDATFYTDVDTYLQEKTRMLPKQSTVFADDEHQKLQKQLDNIRTLLKELYERREKKILHMALLKSRTQSSVVDTSALLEEEKSLLSNLCTTLSSQREVLLHRLLAKTVQAPPPTPLVQEVPAQMTLSFLHYVPKFVGRDLAVYGPFEPGQTATIPRELALVLVAKGRAQELVEKPLQQ